MTTKRMVQGLSLALFLVLLWFASFPLTGWLPVNAFGRLDPLALLGSGLAARAFLDRLWVAVLLLALTFVMGRFFCSHVCPMGTTIDVADRLIRRGKSRGADEPPGSLKRLKYYVLAFTLGAAALGVSLVFLASPISLITRFYGLVVYPFLMLAGDGLLALLRPIGEELDIRFLLFAELPTPRFATQLFIASFFLAVFGLARVSPRFFCRYVCPSGAIFALFSFRPLIRRRVTDECTDCGICQKRCPQGAIPDDPFATDTSECIACQTCVRVCPTNAVSFAPARGGVQKGAEGFIPSRRQFLASGLTGGLAGVLTLTGLHRPENREGPGQLVSPALIRPPGSLPEGDFLARCIRCGECMKGCPTNTLQPIWLAAGFSGLFSPVITPVLGPCEPQCNVCGQVCPTGAIRELEKIEKIWAKVGTAHIIKEKCLAWEFDKRCLICDEVCPYDAVKFKKVPDKKVAVPFVNEARCAGCGYCERYCPVRAKRAIVVEPMAALRLASGSYIEKARELGLSLDVRKEGPYRPKGQELQEGLGPSVLPPGFEE